MRPPRSNILIDKTIQSASNPLFREWKELLASKGIRKQGLFLVSGIRAVTETIERFPESVRSLFLCEERHGGAFTHGAAPLPELDELKEHISQMRDRADSPISVIALGRTLFDELDVFGTHTPMALVRASELKTFDASEAPQGLEIFCGLGDPSNVGALVRTAAAFGASKMILLKESASPFHPKAVRAASAATLLMPYATGPSIRELPSLAISKSPVVALDMMGEDIMRFDWPKDIRILIGEEGQGVPDSRNFKFVSIPMKNGVESLNATVAASLALYSYRLKHE